MLQWTWDLRGFRPSCGMILSAAESDCNRLRGIDLADGLVGLESCKIALIS